MGAMKPWHWIVIIVLVLLLFGANKLPDLARSMGRSMRIFKSEVDEMRDGDEKNDDSKDESSDTYTVRTDRDETPETVRRDSTDRDAR